MGVKDKKKYYGGLLKNPTSKGGSTKKTHTIYRGNVYKGEA